jgi:hypothetical protein
VPHPVQQRRPPTRSAATRARVDGDAARAAHARAAERVERTRAAWARTGTSAHARVTCPGCGLDFPQRRSADPVAGPPLRCLCCAFLLTITDARMREAVRRVLARSELQRRSGGREVSPPVARRGLRLLP